MKIDWINKQIKCGLNIITFTLPHTYNTFKIIRGKGLMTPRTKYVGGGKRYGLII